MKNFGTISDTKFCKRRLSRIPKVFRRDADSLVQIKILNLVPHAHYQRIIQRYLVKHRISWKRFSIKSVFKCCVLPFISTAISIHFIKLLSTSSLNLQEYLCHRVACTMKIRPRTNSILRVCDL